MFHSYVKIKAADLPSNMGTLNAIGDLQSDGTEGHLCYGPYLNLKPGAYTAGFRIMRIAAGQPGALRIEVTDGAQGELSYRDLTTADLLDDTPSFEPIEFDLGIPAEQLEVRLWIALNVLVSVRDLVIFQRSS